MAVTLILAISLLLQIAAAVLALRLIRVTGRRVAWGLVALAISLMAVRRAVTLFQLVAGDPSTPPADLTAELVALATSVLMAAGIAMIAPFFLSASRSERRLKESEEHYRIVAETASDAIITIDESSTILFANPAAEKIFGYTAEELTGKPLTLLMPEYLRHVHRAGMRRYIETTRRHISWEAVELPGLHKSGREIPLELSFGEFLENGRHTFTGIVRDITERKRAQEALQEGEERFRALVDASAQIVWTTDAEGAVVEDSPSWRAFTGQTYEQWEGWGWLDAFHPEDRERVAALWRKAVEEKTPLNTEYRIHHVSGEWRWTAVRAVPLLAPDGSIRGWVGMNTDITEAKRAEEARREAAERFRFLAESMPQKIFTARPNGDVDYFNRQWTEFTGLSFEEIRDWGWTQFIHPDDVEENVRRWRHSVETGEPFQFEHRFRRADGVYRWHLSRAHAMRDAEGRVLMWIGSNTEIDDVKRTEAELREQTEVVETINRVGQTLSAELDLHKVVQAVTDAATELTGARFGSFFYNVINEQGGSYMLYTLSGVPAEAFAHFPMPRATDLFGPTFRGEGVVRIDDVKLDPRYGKNSPYYGMPEGHLPVTSYLAVPVISRSGEVLGGLFFGHTEAGVFTERDERIVTGLAAQAAVAMDNARLFELVQRERAQAEAVAQENARLYEEAERANRLKDEFLATVSHELRTPLTAIIGWSAMLRTNKLDASTSASALETIERNAKAQSQLIEDLMDVSRIITGKLRLDVQAVELAPVVEAAIVSLRPAADARGIKLRAVLDPHAGPVSGDPTRLQQVAWNLLSNAIKFTPKGGRVEVRLERIDSHVELVVSDTGQGIKPEFLPYVFDRFRQADGTTTRAHGGLGLGLAIVRHLVELHGGTVRVGSRGDGHGATFTVVLPLRVINRELSSDEERGHPKAVSGEPHECPPELDGLSVLVVDDEPDARLMLKMMLEQCGAEVKVVASAREAIEEIERLRPDVLVSDIGMPEEDGYSLMRRVRALPAGRGGQIPAAALTAYAGADDRKRALLAGFQAHIPKPVDPTELVAAVASLAGRTGKA